MPPLSADQRTARLIEAYVGLRPESLPALLDLYDEAASFKDPFNEVRGRAAIDRIFGQMFKDLREPRFVVLSAATEGDDAFLSWELHFRRQGRDEIMSIRGASQLRYSPAGRVLVHRDYWDAAEELYEKLPLLGTLMRFLKSRLRA